MKIPAWANKDNNAALFAEIIKSRISIFDIVQRYSNRQLRFFQGGKEARCKCPICDAGRNDAFVVYMESQRFYCNRCERGGDCIDFVKSMFGLKFAEAVKKINADFNLDLDNQDTTDAQHAAKAAAAYREERERQRREAVDDFHRWDDLQATYDQWLQAFPPGDKRHDEAEREIVRVSYKRDCAFQRLKSFE